MKPQEGRATVHISPFGALQVSFSQVLYFERRPHQSPNGNIRVMKGGTAKTRILSVPRPTVER